MNTAQGGASPSGTAGGDLNVRGTSGPISAVLSGSTGAVLTPDGAPSFFGGGGAGAFSGGIGGVGNTGGGAGSSSSQLDATAYRGAKGGSGVIVITEYGV